MLAFADGVYAFGLRAKEVVELQEKCEAGPMEIYRRLLAQAWRFEDVTNTIRLGLIRGGEGWIGGTIDEDGNPTDGQHVKVDATIAAKLVARYVDHFGAPEYDLEDPEPKGGPLPWTLSAIIATRILGAGLMGRKAEPIGKKTSGEGEASPSLSPVDNSGGQQSSPPSPTEA